MIKSTLEELANTKANELTLRRGEIRAPFGIVR
jgi:hypothetical protein